MSHSQRTAIAFAPGYRSRQSNKASLKARSSPELRPDGAMIVPETREQRCWWHKIGNVLNALPKSAQPGAKKALAEIWNTHRPPCPAPSRVPSRGTRFRSR
jgi:hypothetical protein